MIGLIDVDGKLPNLALMKISSFYKALGEKVEFVQPGHKYLKIYASALFTKSYKKCLQLKALYGNLIEIGGTGFDIDKKLPPEMEVMAPDYELYSKESLYNRMRGIGSKETKLAKAEVIAKAGIGFSSRGCIRKCPFCFVPRKEGEFRQASEIKDLLNPKSNVLILNDNNLTADPFCIDKLHEIRDRRLIVDINQGCDVRLITEDIAQALGEVKHLRSLHYAWDLMGFENQVIRGIKVLSKYVKTYQHMCFMLTGFNTSFEEDMYRLRKLDELGVKPYVMVYNQKEEPKLKHFARWVNGRFYKISSFDEYWPWVKVQEQNKQLKIAF